MYEKFYGLSAKPFSVSPDTAVLYVGPEHQRALTLLRYSVREAAAFALLTGEIGCGKTTVVRHFLSLPGAGLRVALIENTHPAMGPMLPWITDALGIERGGSSLSEHYRHFVALARREFAQGRRILLVIDEAQNLSFAQLEELRVLSNLNESSTLMLQSVLVGQTELRTTLRDPGMRQFAQRVVIDHHIGPLKPHETQAYVSHRVGAVAGPARLFSAEAIMRVHEAAGGTPRIVNILCDTALVYGYADRLSIIDTDTVGKVLRDRLHSILPLIEPRTAAIAELAS
jgi:type II secretory pathway predicted ATPase ExeA